MRALSVLALAFLLGCGAATQRGVAEPEPWTEFTQGRITVSAPPGWSDVTQPREGQGVHFSLVQLQNETGHILVVMHPHGNAEAAQQAFLSTYMRSAIMAAVAQQQPGALAEHGIQSMSITDPEGMTSIPGAYMYMITTELTDGTTEENRLVFMFTDPNDESTALLVSTTMPAAEGEEFPAQAIEIVRTMQYAAPE